MKRGTIFRILKEGVLLGITSSVIIFFIVCGFLLIDANTITAHTLTKLAVIGVAVFVGFRYLKSHMEEFHLFHGMLMALVLGISSAVVLTGFELSMHYLADIQLAPTIMLEAGLPQGMLSFLLSVEMMAWSIVGGLAALQYYKKPYGSPKSHTSSRQTSHH